MQVSTKQISIADLILNSKAKRIKQYPRKANWASDLGRECLLYLTYARTHWMERKMHSARLQAIFDLGNDFEKIVLRELDEAGLTVIEQQRSFHWDKYQISGHIDGKLLVGDSAIPLEIKSMSPYVFDSINDVSDIRYHKYEHVRSYLSQITLYELMDGKDTGVLLLKNKVTGAIKDIWVPLDYDHGENLIQKAETINRSIQDGDYPEGAEYDSQRCDECAFVHLCLPEVIGKGVDIVTDEELMDLLPRYWELKPLTREFDEIDSRLKKLLEGRGKLLCGEFFIDGKWIKSTKYNVPKEIKREYKEEFSYWKKQIVKAA